MHLKQKRSLSNWARNNAMTEEEIEAAIASDPDEAGLGDDWMKLGTVVQAKKEKQRSA